METGVFKFKKEQNRKRKKKLFLQVEVRGINNIYFLTY